eukprot:gene12320-15488_t
MANGRGRRVKRRVKKSLDILRLIPENSTLEMNDDAERCSRHKADDAEVAELEASQERLDKEGKDALAKKTSIQGQLEKAHAKDDKAVCHHGWND